MFRYFSIVLIIIAQTVFSQDYQWDIVNSDNSELPNQTIKSIAIDSSGAVWYATYMGGIAVVKDGQWTIYNTSNSELPHNYVNSISVDGNNVKWIGTDGGGLARFDGTNWEVYKTSNSGIPSNVVMTTYCDADGSVWVGTYFGGLAHFNNGLWTIYNDENSNLLSNKVVFITKDQKELLWLGTQGGGVASFDGKNWNVYTERNSKLTNDYIYSIAVDKDNKKWIGTGGGGVVIFNDIYWIKHTSDNSSLTDDNIRPIVIDPKGNKWIGTYIGGINKFDGKNWKVYDFQNSQMPDDEITCMTYYDNVVYVGTERSGIIKLTDLDPIIKKVVEKEIPPAVVVEEVIEKPAEEEPVVVDPVVEEKVDDIPAVVKEDKKEKVEEKEKPKPATAVVTALKPENKIMLVMDAAEVYFDQKKLNQTLKSFKFLLNNREKIDNSYEVRLLIYSSNYDVSPQKIKLDDKQLSAISAKDVIYLDGESTFTEGIKKAYNLIKLDYKQDGNNHVIAATHKFVRDDETAKVVVKDNLDNHYIVFSLLAFKTKSWKMEHKMRTIVPKGNGHYYSITQPELKDNWSVTGHLGMSLFRGDLDVTKNFNFPGVYGVAINKQLISTGLLNGGVKAQFNIGSLEGYKNDKTFKNNYKEACLNFQVIFNRWINHNFSFDKFRPYAFGGVGIINYRVLVKNNEGQVLNGFGYEVIENDLDFNGTDPAKTTTETDLIFPVGLGVNYKINNEISLEGEVSSRYINSDKLDGWERFRDDKYWFFSIGVTYKINTKPFLADILSK